MFKFSHLYHICSMISMKEVTGLQDLGDAVSATTFPHFTPFFSFVLRLLYHHCFCSNMTIFHTGFLVECLLPALVSVFRTNFYCWSLSCLPTCLSECPLSFMSQVSHSLLLPCGSAELWYALSPSDVCKQTSFWQWAPGYHFKYVSPFLNSISSTLSFLSGFNFWFET